MAIAIAYPGDEDRIDSREEKPRDMHTHPMDDQLMAATAKGDQEAFAQLFKRHWAWSLGVCRGRMGRYRLAFLAEDACLRAWLKIWDNAGKYKCNGKLEAWIGTICRNACVDVKRGWTTRAQDPPNFVGLPNDDTLQAVGELDPIRQLERQEDTKRVRDALRLLTRRQRRIVTLRFWHGATWQQIASVLGLSVRQVHAVFLAALITLRRALKDPDA